MKKKLFIVLIAAALALVLTLCAGCKVKFGEANELYPQLASSDKVQQTIRITGGNGNVLQYERVRTYTKSGSGYAWTQTEKTLNDLNSDSDEPYTYSPESQGTVAFAEFAPNLKLDDESLFSEVTSQKGLLTLTVAQGNEFTVLGLSNVSFYCENLTVSFKVEKKLLAEVTISYEFENSDVAIILTIVR